MSARRHNAVLRAAHRRVDELEPRLVSAVAPLLERAGEVAARNFRARAVDHLAASALRDLDRAALARLDAADERGRPDGLALVASAVAANATMVCVKPTPEQAAALADPDGEPADVLHVTLCYLGEVDGPLEPVAEALAPVAASHGPLSGVVGGYGRFGAGDGPGVGLLLPDVPGLVELRVAVTDALVAAGVGYSRDHGFLAHVTVDQDPEPDELDAMRSRFGLPLSFSELLVVRGDVEVVAVPLVGRPPLTASADPEFCLPAELRARTDPVRRALVESVARETLEGVGLSFDATHPLIGAVIGQAGQHIQGVAQTTQLDVMRVVRASYDAGLSIPDTAKAIRDAMNAESLTRATLIARTELTAAANGASLAATRIANDAASADTGVDAYEKEWLCVAPGTRVRAAGVIAAVRKWHDGELVTVTTRTSARLGGSSPALRSFSVTPDHRVLTRHGWMPAGLLDEGDEVVSDALAERDRLRDPHVDDVQPLIEEIFDAVAERASAVGVMSSPVYLHGDAIGEKIDVESTDRDLGFGADPATSEPLREFMLALTDVSIDRLLRERSPFDLDVAEATTSVTRRGERDGMIGGGGVALIAQPVGLDLRPESHPSLKQDDLRESVGDPELAGEGLHRLSRLVSLNEVVGVERRPYSGHVYDITTLSGWFFADGYVAHNTAPGAVFPRHELVDGLDGQTVPLDATFDVDGEPLQYPGDPDGSPENVCNCFPAETLVEMPRLRASMRRWYEGELVRLRFSSGDVLAATPNHPVLRADGQWVPLGEVEEGDHLVSARLAWNDAGAPDPERPPAEIGEVHRLASVAGGTERVRLRPPDLHGDGADGEVEVVALDGQLLLDVEAASDEDVAEFGLALAAAASVTRAVGGDESLAVGDGVGEHFSWSAARGVGGVSERATVFVAHPLHPDLVRVGSVSDRQAHLREPQADGAAVYTDLLADREDAVAALVSLAEVIDVEVEPFHGYVYNLDTGAGWYTAGTIACRNCRCGMAYRDRTGQETGEAESVEASGLCDAHGPRHVVGRLGGDRELALLAAGMVAAGSAGWTPPAPSEILNVDCSSSRSRRAARPGIGAPERNADSAPEATA